MITTTTATTTTTSTTTKYLTEIETATEGKSKENEETGTCFIRWMYVPR